MFRSHFGRLAPKITFIALVVISLVRASSAQTDGVLTMKQTTVINEVGDANVELQICTNLQTYTQLKTETPNVALLLRQFGAGRTWSEMEDIDGHFDDATHTVMISYRHRGAGREIQRGQVVDSAERDEGSGSRWKLWPGFDH